MNNRSPFQKKYKVISEIINNTKSDECMLIKTCNQVIDSPARDADINYIRLNGNEVAHCAGIKKDSTETLLLLMFFQKYCQKLTELLATINNIQ